jgi:hypothetical protein
MCNILGGGLLQLQGAAIRAMNKPLHPGRPWRVVPRCSTLLCRARPQRGQTRRGSMRTHGSTHAPCCKRSATTPWFHARIARSLHTEIAELQVGIGPIWPGQCQCSCMFCTRQPGTSCLALQYLGYVPKYGCRAPMLPIFFFKLGFL